MPIQRFRLDLRYPSPVRLLLPIVSLGIVGFCLIGCTGESGADVADDKTAALEVHRGPFRQRLLLTGELVAENAIQLTTPNANIWPVPIRWVAEDGVEVRAGETVAEFDSTQIGTSLENLESQVVEAHNQLLSVRSDLANQIGGAVFNREQRRADFEKAEIAAAVPAEISSKQDFERNRLELEKARLELAAAEEQLAAKRQAAEHQLAVQKLAVEKAEKDAERALRSLELLTLQAPRDGIVLLGNEPREGRPLQAGDSVFPGTTIASLPDLSTLMVEASLFDVDDGKIQPGAEVLAALDSFPEWSIPGVIRDIENIADQPDPRSTRRAFKALIDLAEIDIERMRPGMSVKVEVMASSNASQAEHLLIPRAALQPEGRQILAYLRDGTSVPVELGPCNPDVCVLRGGLDEGARLRTAEAGD